jgi:hypothetical protein
LPRSRYPFKYPSKWGFTDLEYHRKINSLSALNVAFIKQDVYQDLYVAGPKATASEILFSSFARVGPIGLFTLCNADYYIIKEEDVPECRAWEKVIPHYRPEWLRQLKDRPYSETNLPEAGLFQTSTNRIHSDYSVAADEVNWSTYDLVIGINFPVPRTIVESHRNTLWCYMIGEANVFLDRIYHGYDASLNQDTRGLIASTPGFIDFPYSFVGPTCLETLMEKTMGRPSQRHGIFIEINSIPERPVRNLPPHLSPLLNQGHPVRLHRQNIRENLAELFDSKYFVKIGGRFIRGNSVIEAISCGALVLMNPAELHHSQLLPKDTWIYSIEDACRKIAALERDADEYHRLQSVQRSLVQSFVIDAPWESLRNCLNSKRDAPPPRRRSLLRRVIAEFRRRVTHKL